MLCERFKVKTNLRLQEAPENTGLQQDKLNVMEKAIISQALRRANIPKFNSQQYKQLDALYAKVKQTWYNKVATQGAFNRYVDDTIWVMS